MSGNTSQRRIAVTGGGTAGHILPGLELLRMYRREWGADGYFIGCRGGLESLIVPDRGERLELIPGRPVKRTGWAGKTGAVGAVLPGVWSAREILRRERTELVIGFGGYASFNACLAARSMGLPVVIHEANAEPGLANWILGRIAQKVCIGFAEAASSFGSAKVVHTGTPCSVTAPGAPSPVVRTYLAPHRFLVLGGSMGSPYLNQAAPRLFAALKQKGRQFSVRHMAGFQDTAQVQREYDAVGVEARVDCFTKDMPAVYAAADFAVACAGGLTLAELAAAGLPALLIPLSAASNDHQSANARAYAGHTGTPWVAESQWDVERESARIERLLDHPESLRELGRRALQWPVRDSTRRIAATCEELLGHAADLHVDPMIATRRE